ncbi:Zn-ribbon domain-containing OB-fold protein [Myxococcota bacterium]|nr:Zn-ribbon domain-containing OB-fold protein [Myxococcota bacterium]
MSDQARSPIPLPVPTQISSPHWEGCRKGELRVQQCGSCGGYVFIPQSFCTHCFSKDLRWVVSSGRGVVYSCTTIHRPQRIEFEVPYTVAIVELSEGWHMLSNIIECAHEDIKVGMPVEVVFQKMSDEITLPMFRPVTE